ncbi:MAG TPA: plastocyanin/azurin family copper-binding protein [Pyrinomonadaceae bacterium]|nr:plastocyanin/azurin family copper-binding protein [Pyrinomonadaceae bacterium]
MKALGLLITALLVGITSCKPPETNQNTASPTVTATATPTPSPTAAVSPTSTAPTTATVKGSNLKWQDDASGTPVTTIKVGGTVTWTITGGTHQLERVAGSAANGCGELDASFDSNNMTSGQSVSRTFTKVGTFGYHCGIHQGTPNCTTPPGSGPMPGVIKVVP